MAIKRYNQHKLKGYIGKSKVLLSRYGCLICSICSLSSRFWKHSIIPQEATKTWSFTSQGLLEWGSDFDGMKFENRIHRPPTNEELRYWCRTKDRGMVLELNNGSHWVFVWYYPFSIGVEGTLVLDSLGAKYYLLGLSKYKCTGFATFSKSI